jgi:predicted RNase H-like nuclease (RuvC/YqgF family)
MGKKQKSGKTSALYVDVRAADRLYRPQLRRLKAENVALKDAKEKLSPEVRRLKAENLALRDELEKLRRNQAIDQLRSRTVITALQRNLARSS